MILGPSLIMRRNRLRWALLVSHSEITGWAEPAFWKVTDLRIAENTEHQLIRRETRTSEQSPTRPAHSDSPQQKGYISRVWDGDL